MSITEKLLHYYPDAQFALTSDADFSTLQWFGPGDAPDETTFAALEWPALDVLRLTKWEAVKVLRDDAINGGVNVAGIGPFQSDEISRGYITGAVVMAQTALANSQPFAMDWTLADNSVASLDGPTMIAVGIAVGQHIAACHERAQVLRAAIESAANTAALAAIDITTGWPENA